MIIAPAVGMMDVPIHDAIHAALEGLSEAARWGTWIVWALHRGHDGRSGATDPV